MSYVVMECHPGYVVLLDEEGRFLKAANLRYEVGQTVYDPVLMKEDVQRLQVLHALSLRTGHSRHSAALQPLRQRGQYTQKQPG